MYQLQYCMHLMQGLISDDRKASTFASGYIVMVRRGPFLACVCRILYIPFKLVFQHLRQAFYAKGLYLKENDAALPSLGPISIPSFRIEQFRIEHLLLPEIPTYLVQVPNHRLGILSVVECAGTSLSRTYSPKQYVLNFVLGTRASTPVT